MMKLMSLKQYMKMSKPALIRKITKTLRAMPKKRLAVLCYNITKSKLPRLKVIKRKALPKRKTKRKFSRKQLAAQRLFAKRARAGTLKRRRR
jgi:predicted transcriptional regulator YheO